MVNVCQLLFICLSSALDEECEEDLNLADFPIHFLSLCKACNIILHAQVDDM
jgi:hypothetical protein